MGEGNIAIVFAPSLFRGQDNNNNLSAGNFGTLRALNEALLGDQGEAKSIIEFMIANYDQIFQVFYFISFFSY